MASAPDPKVPSTARRGLYAVLIAAAAGIAIGLLLLPRSEQVDDTEAPPPAVRLLGQRLRLDDGAPERALEAVRRHVSGWLHLEVPGDAKRRFSFGKLGVRIDKVRLANLVRDARDPTSPLRRTLRRRGSRGPIDLPVPLVIDPDEALPVLLDLKDQYDRVPRDARIDLAKKKLVPEIDGRLLDVDRTLDNLEQTLQRGARTVPIAFEARPAARRAADLGQVELDEVLGYFETSYDRSDRAAARTYNLRLAASKLDGYVLLPGETFDFNEVVGPRDEANGYKVAPVIAQGELVDGIGGGTCQVSGTLHAAAFFAGLEIVERYPHTRPSSYIKMGLDATVVYPTINFRVKNSYDFPVVLHETVRHGVVRAEILGKKQPRTVTLIRRIREAIPYQQTERPDDRLPRGERVLVQRGVPGFKLTRYRILREGDHAVRERWLDTYPPTTQIVRVGTGPPSSDVRQRNDPHPEYIADELLVMTQGPDIFASDDSREKGTLEQREPGKFGEYGWTREAHMPVFEPGPQG